MVRHPALTLMLAGLLAALVLAGQFHFHGPSLHNEVMKSAFNDFNDSLDYAKRAEGIVARGFVETFSDAHRMPGYPAFLSVFVAMAEEPWRAARVAQILLTGLLPLIAWWCVRPFGSRSLSLLAPAAVALWPPLYYFSSALTAESLTIVGAALYLGACLRLIRNPATGIAITTAVILVFLISLKPNAIFLSLVPVVGILWSRGLSDVKEALPAYLTLAGLTTLLVLPWTLFASLSNGQFVPFTTMQGTVLCAGVGGIYSLPGEIARIEIPSLMDHARTLLGIDVQCYVGRTGMKPELHAYLQGIALDRWQEHPGTTALYGLAKIGHLLGFSLRSPADWLSAVFFVASFGAAIILVRK
ncbi:MAG: hypothetical protein ACPGNT_11875, partial [Rhodospirillales bacterium]